MTNIELLTLCQRYFPGLEWKMDDSSDFWGGFYALFPEPFESNYIALYCREIDGETRCVAEWRKDTHYMFYTKKVEGLVAEQALTELKHKIAKYHVTLWKVLRV